MKLAYTMSVITAPCCAALLANAAASAELPKGWLHAGSRPSQYEMSVDRTVAHGGHASASVKSIAEATDGFGTLMQTFKADTFRGKRVRMSGYVQSKDVSDWAGLWMRVDGPVLAESKVPEPLAFDNMQKRAIKGTTDWSRYEIVLDVPERAEEIAFGILLSRQGQVWLDDVQFEVVSKAVPTTSDSLADARDVPRTPVNLGFEE